MAACIVTPSNSPTVRAIKPTDDPPSLEHIADKTTREWIYAWLKDPQAYAVTATMPNFKLSERGRARHFGFLDLEQHTNPRSHGTGQQRFESA